MIIRNYQSGDEKSINNLHNSTYNVNRTLEHWEWEFKKNHLGRTIFVVVDDREQITGSQSLIPAYLNIKGEKIYSAKSEATLLAPGYRGKNLFDEMYKLAFSEAEKDDIKIIWGFTNAIKSFSKIGFTITTPISLMWYINNVFVAFNYIYNKHIVKGRYKIIKSIMALAGLLFFRIRSILAEVGKFNSNPNKIFSVHQLDDFNKDTNILFDDFIKDFPNIITLWRDQLDLQWRTMANPIGTPYIWGLFVEERLAGYAVVIHNQEEKILTLQDIIVRKQYLQEGTICLLNRIKDFSKEIKVGLIRNPFILSKGIISQNNFTCFSRAGFCTLPFKTATVIKIMDKIMDKTFIQDIDNWYITGLFTEGF